jgi:hypothetical protein
VLYTGHVKEPRGQTVYSIRARDWFPDSLVSYSCLFNVYNIYLLRVIVNDFKAV